MTISNRKNIAAIWASAESCGAVALDAAAKALGVSKEDALELLAQDALADARTFASPRTSHFMDLAVVLTLAGLVVFSWFAYHQPIAGRPMRVTIAAANGVKILQIIAPSDVELKPAQEVRGSFAKLDEVVGRYALKPMKKDELVIARDLSSNPLPGKLAGRSQLLLPLNSGPLANTLSLPGIVSVIATPKCDRTNPKPLALVDVYIMAFNSSTNPTAAVVAVTSDQLALLTPILGCSEFTLVKKIEAPQ